MNSTTEQLIEARNEHALRIEAHRALEERFSDLYMDAMRLTKQGKASDALDLTAQRIKVGEQRDLAHQLLQMASARVQRCERALLDEAKKVLRKQYAKQAWDIAITVAAMIEADQRAGDVSQCAALSRFAIPAWDRMHADDTGLIEGFHTLDFHRADAVAMLNALLVQEPAPVEEVTE